MTEAIISTVRTAWRQAASATSGGRSWRAVRFPASGTLKMYAAVREADNARAILVEAPIEEAPNERASFEADGLSMHEERVSAERLYRLAITLERQDLLNIFEIVAADLVETVAPCRSATVAVTALHSRLQAWQAFLRARRSGLGPEAVVGLVGELIFLRRLASGIGWQASVEAWEGPDRGLQDFKRHGYAIEVKAAAGTATTVRITSLDQLDASGLAVLLLAHIQLVERLGGESLPDIVNSIAREIALEAPGLIRSFRERLMAVGYTDVDAELYATRAFSLIAMDVYRVGNEFPRLARSGLDAAIVEASYQLDVRALRAHLADDEVLREVFQGMGAIANGRTD